MRELKTFGIAKSILIIGLCCSFHAAAQDGDPKLPEFRRHSTDEQIADALKESKVEEKLAAFAAGDGAFPDRGAYVTFWTEGSPFSKLGIPVGSVLRRDRDVRYPSHPLFVRINPELLGDDLEKIVWVSPDNQHRETELPPGPHSTYIRGYRNLLNYYLRNGQRGPKWDPYVLAALDHQGKDPLVAETCWAKAFSEGFRHDKLSSWSGMLLALDKQEMERAAAFARHFAPFEIAADAEIFPIQLDDIYRIALMTGDPQWFDQVGDMLRKDPTYARHLPNFLRQIEIAAEVPKGTPPPSVLAEKMVRASFLMDADTSPVPWCSNGQRAVLMHEWAAMAHMKGVKEFPEHRFEASFGSFAAYFFSPAKPSRDVDVEIRFRIEPKPTPQDQAGGFDRVFLFGLADRVVGEVNDVGPWKDSRILLAKINFEVNDTRDVPYWEIGTYGKAQAPMLNVWQGLARNPSPLLVPSSVPYRHDPQHVHTLRIVRVGPQAEALLDGKRFALVHVPSDLKTPGVHFKVVGCRVTVISFKADTLK